LLASAFVSLYSTTDNKVDLHFDNFMTKYGKNYQTEEEFNFRRSVFAESLNEIEEFNAKGKSWTLGVNQFSDWTKEEYKQLLGYKRNIKNDFTESMIKDMPTNCPKPSNKAIDWREKDFVTPVKNQGACGSCWAFSAVAALEAAYAKKFGELVSFAEQQLVDCNKFSHGCNGGLMVNGFIHWMHNAPRTEADYEYHAKDEKCQEDKISTKYPELNYGYRVDITQECLYDALTHNVVSVAIRAEEGPFRHYKEGVIDESYECGTDLDHGVTLVGYDADKNAWIVKNSWGADWGQSGYVYIKKADGLGICGINQENSQPTWNEEEWQ
jgi:xylem cysteine proteinase